MGSAWVEGGGEAGYTKPAFLLSRVGGRGRREQPSLFYIHLNAADFSFSYLRFAEAASFNKKELRRSCTKGLLRKISPFLNTFFGGGEYGGGR